MGRSMFNTLELAKRAIQAQRTALDITSHNIANANTPGYSRQRAEMSATNPYLIPEMNTAATSNRVGTGVQIDGIKRVRDTFLDFQYRSELHRKGFWQETHAQINRLETIINEPSDNGLRQVMDRFFNAWQELSKDPSSLSARSVVKQESKALAESFTHVNRMLIQSQKNIEHAKKQETKEINVLLSQIAKVNEQIAVAELGGHQANDFLDQRDLAIDKLSAKLNIEVHETRNKKGIRITTINAIDSSGNKWNLVEHDVNNYLGLQDTNSDGVAEIYVHKPDNSLLSAAELTKEVSGTLGALVHTHDRVESYKQDLDSLATNMVNEVNNQHSSGHYTLDNGATFSTGTAQYFELDTTTDSYMTLNSVFDNPDGLKHIAVSDSNTTLNGNNALAIAGLNQEEIPGLNDGTFNDYYNSYVAELGIETQESERMLGNQDLLVRQIDNQRESIKGVSVDEEMMNMVRFQHAYNAAARITSTFDEMLDVIVNRMGIVGR